MRSFEFASNACSSLNADAISIDRAGCTGCVWKWPALTYTLNPNTTLVSQTAWDHSFRQKPQCASGIFEPRCLEKVVRNFFTCVFGLCSVLDSGDYLFPQIPTNQRWNVSLNFFSLCFCIAIFYEILIRLFIKTDLLSIWILPLDGAWIQVMFLGGLTCPRLAPLLVSLPNSFKLFFLQI